MPTDQSALSYEETRIIYWLERADGRLTRSQLRRKVPDPRRWEVFEPAIASLVERGMLESFVDWMSLLEKGKRCGRPPTIYRLTSTGAQ
jgi:hypothetical protein